MDNTIGTKTAAGIRHLASESKEFYTIRDVVNFFISKYLLQHLIDFLLAAQKGIIGLLIWIVAKQVRLRRDYTTGEIQFLLPEEEFQHLKRLHQSVADPIAPLCVGFSA